jgi:hypothetical protein
MHDREKSQPDENAPHHETSDPASLKLDPAQVYPTGGAGLAPPGRQPPEEPGEPDRADQHD